MTRAQARSGFGGLITLMLLPGCGSPAVSKTAPPQSSATVSPAPFVGRVWIATDPTAAPGSFRIFLPDGTLIMDSCVETYRLARWETRGNERVAWREDAAEIEADVNLLASDRLRLRLHLVAEIKEEEFRLAQVPFVCPEQRAGASASVGMAARF